MPLAADAELDQDEIGVVDGGRGVIGQGQAAGPIDPIQHALGEAANDLQPVEIEVVEHELVDRQAVAAVGEPVDQLGGVRVPPPMTATLMPNRHLVDGKVLTT